jgi:AcrR family transcriptional regulator
MARPKGYDRDTVLLAARDLFWEQGYHATSIAELEQSTGLNRSSIYQEFGSKHGLFEAALECYIDRVVAMLFADMRGEDARLETVVALFERLGRLFRCDQAISARGCLMVNSTAELAARDGRVRPMAASHRDRLRADLASALKRAAAAGEVDEASVAARGHLLASTLMGIWLTVRIDRMDAASLCDVVAGEVAAWRTR